MNTQGYTEEQQKGIIRKIMWRIMPLLIICFFINYLDRVNVGFAALTMNADLGFDAKIYGFGAGIFFIGYFLFEVPSNMALHKIGARLWIPRIMITWGIIAVAMAWIQGPISFYVLRFLLGVAEAGFFPAMILYITYWFPDRYRAKAVALLYLGSLSANILGSIISTWLMSHPIAESFGLTGWQFMFIAEGVPAVLLGIYVFFVLKDRPTDVKWLSDDEKGWLQSELAENESIANKTAKFSLWKTLFDPRVIALSAVYFLHSFSNYSLLFFLPQIIQGFQEFGVVLSLTQVGLINAIPFVFAMIAMFIWGAWSDKSQNKALWVAIPFVVMGLGLIACTHFQSPIIVMIAASFAMVAVFCVLPPFWKLPPAFLTGPAAAAGIGMVNSFGGLGGFAGPYVTGWLKTGSNNFSLPFDFAAVGTFIAAIIVVVIATKIRNAQSKSK